MDTSTFSRSISGEGEITICNNDALSEITCDDDTVDMAEGKIHCRDWLTLGSKAPSEAPADEYFWMIHIDRMTKSISEDPFRDMVLREYEEATFEAVPIYAEVLGNYYNYFIECDADGHRGDRLLNLCMSCAKSPVFDIQGCVLIKFDKDVPNSIEVVDIDGVRCGLFIAAGVTNCIIDQLFAMNIQVEVTSQDTWPYASSRVAASPYVMPCEIADGDWRSSPDLRGLSRHVKYNAVTTAIFTISVLLSPSLTGRGRHSSKYSLKYIVHNIK